MVLLLLSFKVEFIFISPASNRKQKKNNVYSLHDRCIITTAHLASFSHSILTCTRFLSTRLSSLCWTLARFSLKARLGTSTGPSTGLHPSSSALHAALAPFRPLGEATVNYNAICNNLGVSV